MKCFPFPLSQMTSSQTWTRRRVTAHFIPCGAPGYESILIASILFFHETRPFGDTWAPRLGRLIVLQTRMEQQQFSEARNLGYRLESYEQPWNHSQGYFRNVDDASRERSRPPPQWHGLRLPPAECFLCAWWQATKETPLQGLRISPSSIAKVCSIIHFTKTKDS